MASGARRAWQFCRIKAALASGASYGRACMGWVVLTGGANAGSLKATGAA